MASTNYDKETIKKLAFLIIATYITIFSLLGVLLEPGGKTSDVVLSALYVLPICAAFIASLWAAGRTKSYKRLWRLMAMGMFCWLAGAVTLSAYTVSLGVENVPSPSIADLFLIAYLPIILGIMFSLARVRPPFDNEKKRFLINVSMAALAMFLLCFKFILAPSWYANPDIGYLERIYAITYPTFDWIVFVSLLFASYRFREGKVEGWFIFLTSAFAFSILADVIYYLNDNQMNAATTLALVATAILITLSAIDEVTGAFIGAKNKISEKLQDMLNTKSLILNPLETIVAPFLIMMVIPIVWIYSSHSERLIENIVLATVSSVIIVLLIYRNHLLALDNSILFTKALRDSLTGLNNHRYFQESLKKLVAKSNNTGNSVALVVIDVDNFAQFNNLHGHAIGDRVLMTIGSTILSAIREADEACRLSGDEFALILPKTSAMEAYVFAEALRDNINNALKAMFPKEPPTITMGISTYPALAKSRVELVRTADGALYWGKFHGKNIISVYDPEVVDILSAEDRARKAEESSFLDIVKSLAEAVDACDPYTRLHSQGVSLVAGRLAEKLGFDKRAISKIKAAGILHDVGKIGMPDNILSKPGRLSKEEMDTVKNHPVLSGQIIQSTSLKDMVPGVRAHHERWDGKGYPDGLKGEEIPLEARILAIADTFDAMTTDRPYRKALSVEEALLEIKQCSGTQFDPKLVDEFLEMFSMSDRSTEADELTSGQTDISYNLASGQ